MDAIYLPVDFAKAFDTVPHQRLLVKLAGYRIGDKMLSWMAAFLEGWHQRVLVSGNKLLCSPITSSILMLIRRSFAYLDGPTKKNLPVYTSLVRPILEYGNVAWDPTLKRHQQMIENVQRRTPKLVPELKKIEYGDRLRALKLLRLYYREQEET